MKSTNKLNIRPRGLNRKPVLEALEDRRLLTTTTINFDDVLAPLYCPQVADYFSRSCVNFTFSRTIHTVGANILSSDDNYGTGIPSSFPNYLFVEAGPVNTPLGSYPTQNFTFASPI